MKNKNDAWYGFFLKFFSIYFIIGFVLITFAYVYPEGIRSQLNDLPFWQNFLNLFATLSGVAGASLIVASLFSFSIESKRFIEYIKNQLENVMIKKELLDKLNPMDKKEALKRIMTPGSEQFEMFSNIKNYFEETIEKDLALFDYNFKSHSTVDINTRIKNSKVCMEGIISHRLYKGKNGYNPIKIGFEKKDSELISAQYILPNGEKMELKPENFNIKKEEEESGFKWKMYSHDIPNTVTADFITVIINYIEYGYDHWQLFTHKTIVPSDGIRITINCYDDLVIKESMIFDNDRNYYFSLTDDKKILVISSSQWISPGNGLNVLIAKEDI